MKKITVFLAGLFMCTSSILADTSYYREYDINESFEAADAVAWTITGNYAGCASIQNVPSYSATEHGTKALRIQKSGNQTGISGSRDLGTLTLSADDKLWIDFDWVANNGQNLYNGGNGGYIYFKDADGKIILGFNVGRGNSDNNLHLLNLDNTVVDVPESSTTLIVPTGGSFNLQNQWVHIHAVLNFDTQKIDSLKMTANNGSIVYENNGLSFHDETAGMLTAFDLRFFSPTSTNATRWEPWFDNFQIYQLVEAVPTDITIKYLDSDDTEVKTQRTELNVPVGSAYTILESDKESFSDAGYYYVYDAVATTDNVTVTANATINLYFTKTPLQAGLYTWNGTTNNNWNESDINFDVNSATSAYQQGNTVLFSTATNKDVIITSDLDINSENVTVSADGYSFISSTGEEKLTGTGKFIVDLNDGEVVTIDIATELTEGLEITGGAAHIKNAAAATQYTVADGAKLVLEAGNMGTSSTIIPIAGAGEISIDAVSANATYFANITGVNTINIALAGNSTWTGTSFPTDVELKLTNPTPATPVIFEKGTSANYTIGSLYLGEGIRVCPDDSETYNRTFTFGELNGVAGSYLEGINATNTGRVMTYKIGGGDFAGDIRPYNGNTTNAPQIVVEKTGSGTWSFTGEASYPNGSFTVSAGTVVMDGSITNSNIAITVASGATLSGSGNIAGATTVNGTLDISDGMAFGSDLTLAGATVATMTDFDSFATPITVVGDITYGGTLNVVITNTPASDDDVALFDLSASTGSIDGDFTILINGAANGAYIFEPTTGILSYDADYTNLNNTALPVLKVYVANNNLIIDGITVGSGYAVYDVTGITINDGIASSSIIEIPLSTSGIYFVKTENNTYKIVK